MRLISTQSDLYVRSIHCCLRYLNSCLYCLLIVLHFSYQIPTATSSSSPRSDPGPSTSRSGQAPVLSAAIHRSSSPHYVPSPPSSLSDAEFEVKQILCEKCARSISLHGDKCVWCVSQHNYSKFCISLGLTYVYNTCTMEPLGGHSQVWHALSVHEANCMGV